MKVKDLPTTTGGSTSDFIIKDNAAGTATEKITVSNLATLMNVAATHLKYVALLTQTGTSNPTVTVLESTLSGAIVWTRSSAGQYVGTLASAFTANKTLIPPFGYDNSGDDLVYQSIGYDSGAGTSFYTIVRTDANTLRLSVFDNTGTNVDLSTLITTNSILVEIRIYP